MAHTGRVRLLLPQHERPLGRVHGVVELAGHRRLDGVGLQQGRLGRGGVAVREAQCPLVVRRRFAVGTGGCCRSGGLGRDPGQGLVVACPLGVMHQTGGVRPDRLQRHEYPCVSLSGAQRRERLLDGPARELVTERHRVLVHGEHSPLLRGQGVLDPARAQHVQQGRLGAGRDDCEQLEQGPGRRGQRRQPGQHRVAHRRGDPFILGREQLGDVERVAARRGVHPQPPVGLARQPRHRLR